MCKITFSLPARNYKATVDLTIKILNMASKQTSVKNHKISRISPERMYNPCGFTMEISSRCNRLAIYDVKRNTKTDININKNKSVFRLPPEKQGKPRDVGYILSTHSG